MEADVTLISGLDVLAASEVRDGVVTSFDLPAAREALFDQATRRVSARSAPPETVRTAVAQSTALRAPLMAEAAR